MLFFSQSWTNRLDLAFLTLCLTMIMIWRSILSSNRRSSKNLLENLSRHRQSTLTYLPNIHCFQSVLPLEKRSISIFLTFYLKENPLLNAELDRVSSHKPLEVLDVARYQLPEPDPSNSSEEEWKSSLQNAKAQLEHQILRHVFFFI